jgi:glutamine synthetase
LYHLDEAELKLRNIGVLPATLGEALAELEKDEVVREALGDHVFERFVEAKRKEWDEYRMYVSHWELDRYLEIY